MKYELVLGGEGFVGSQLVQTLCSHGAFVMSVDRQSLSPTHHPRVKSRILDLFSCTDGDLEELISGARVVYHLVWSSIPASAQADPSRDLTDNVGLTVRILKVAARAGARVVFVSSGGTVYGEGITPELAEDHPCRPMSAYGAGKLAAEVYADFFQRTQDLDVRIARLSNPYGAGQHASRPQGAVSRFARNALLGEAIEVWGNGEVVRDYIHVSDTVECLQRLGEAPREALAGHTIFNVGSGHGISLKDVIATIAAAVERPLDVSFLPGRTIDISRNVLSIVRIQATLGWAPRLDFTSGVKTLISDLRDSVSLPS